MAGALAGIKVLDLSRVLAGPWASQTLADLGADVVKVERPGAGDDTRHWGPPNLSTAAGEPTTESAYFQSANRGKRSLTLDFTQPEGQALVLKLAAQADILLENYKVGGLAKYGLDYASLRKLNPGLIYCSITGFGQQGPYKQRPGYDAMIQAMGGLMSLTGEPEGMPVKVGVALADIMTGLYASTGILAALHHRNRTGEGQHLDLALLDVQVATLANQAMNYLVSGETPKRYGNAHPNIVPYQAFAVADGHLMLAVGNDGQFRRFCEVAGAAELADDPRFATNDERVRHRQQLLPLLEPLLLQKDLDTWLAQLEAANVPCGPINTLDRVFRDPQVQARQMLVELEHASAGLRPYVGSPLKFSATPVDYHRAPPLLGQHTAEVLADWLSLSAERVAELHEQGVV
ncbi:CaiB/BaiF CoA transferase family protein [Balneatrix alpica]|uniref:CaiB/BaiF CoA transferase family protein n=1 Tax=Balneatrix alpica TaxID=75684 RepID=UPI0027395534|nr:CaiB/BaiF CoA-transferase family protein [Balneatrix alpica]